MKKITFPRWDAVPRGFIGRKTAGKRKVLPGLIHKLETLSEARLYLTLALLCQHSGSVELTNVELMELAGLSKASFFRARGSLQYAYKVLDCLELDKRREVYRFKVLEYFAESSEGSDVATAPGAAYIQAIPYEQLMAVLNPVPTLDGRQRAEQVDEQ